jgi:hypothetical protein
MQTVKINRGITSAMAAPPHNPVAEYIREFRAQAKLCMGRLHETEVGNICQWIDTSVTVAASPADVLYQGIPAAVVQGSIDGDCLKTSQSAAKNSYKNVSLSSSDCVSVESFLLALNMHAIYRVQDPKCADEDADADRGTFWKVPRSTSKSASIACVCNWFKTSGKAILLCIDCFEKISTQILSDIVAILWSARFELPVVMLLMSQCDSETIRQALSFSQSRHLRINHFFRLPSPSEQLEHFFSSVLAGDNSLPMLLDPQSVIILRNRFHQTERIVDSFVDGIVFTVLLHSYHNPNAGTFFEFHSLKASCSQARGPLSDDKIQNLYVRMTDSDYLAEINKFPSIASSQIKISAVNVCQLFGYLCVRRTAFYAVPLLFRPLLTSFTTRLTDMWGDTLVSIYSDPVWDGVELGDGCEGSAAEKINHVDRIRFVLWTCTPHVARKLIEDFGVALSQARAAIQAEHEFVKKFIREFSSAESGDKKKTSSDQFLAEVPALLEALKLAQSSLSSLATVGEDGNWDAPFISKTRDDCESSSSTHPLKRRKVLGTAAVKAACGSNRVKFRCANLARTVLHNIAVQRQINIFFFQMRVMGNYR